MAEVQILVTGTLFTLSQHLTHQQWKVVSGLASGFIFIGVQGGLGKDTGGCTHRDLFFLVISS